MSEPQEEITLRKYEKPSVLKGRELVRKFCLSFGLLQPNDGRDVIVSVVSTLLNSKVPLSQSEIAHVINSSGKPSAHSNIRRQMSRLSAAKLLEKHGTKYALRPLHIAADEHEKLYVPAILERVKEYCHELEKVRCGDENGSKKQ